MPYNLDLEPMGQASGVLTIDIVILVDQFSIIDSCMDFDVDAMVIIIFPSVLIFLTWFR